MACMVAFAVLATASADTSFMFDYFLAIFVYVFFLLMSAYLRPLLLTPYSVSCHTEDNTS